MKKKYSYLIGGLLLSFILVFVGGFLYLNVKSKPNNILKLISSSAINSLVTEKEKDDKIEEVVDTKSESEKIEKKDEIKTESNVEEKEESSKKEEVIEPVKKQEEVKQPEPKKEVSIQGNYSPNTSVSGTASSLNTYYGKITAYGPDCYGCTSGRTASGQYVLEGNIYYSDSTYGNVRIVAADASLPFGTIVKITGINISSEPVIAIVLDRGGAIGFASNKHAYFDLLYPTEASASNFGIQDATFDILRLGY